MVRIYEVIDTHAKPYFILELGDGGDMFDHIMQHKGWLAGLTMIMDCRYTVPPHVSAQCTDLISRMLQQDPKRRASLEQIEDHA